MEARVYVFCEVRNRLHIQITVIPVTGCGGLWSCAISSIAQFLDSWLTDGGKVVRLTSRPLLHSPGTLFSLILIYVRG
jgi:hypothetical protein